ncbi:rootletin [Caerostris extrusa]|uniref:Rootletin n=1 Tax=Caerostris extrusa TaxID=172846 RepID=A0AAV4UH27_CAEEX|nr:rootletin [Caerostris extrusa]
MEIENQTLQQRVQNLQVQLTELEERHSQRMKDFLKSQTSESKLEENRLRTALKQSEREMEEKEKAYRRKILGLEKAGMKKNCWLKQKDSMLQTETELSTSPGISVLTTSKLQRSGSYTQRTSTPKVKRRLDMSSKS